MVCADIYLTQRKFDFFSKYYKKAEHIFKPPSHDSEWQNKNEWLACKIILGMLRASHLAKEGNLTETLEILESIKSERFVKSSSILLRKIYWGLGTLYNQYKEKEKSIECFKGGLKISDLEDEFHKSIKLEEEDYFLIYYVYFKYKTSKLLKAIKKSEEALSILKEAAFNIKEISEKSKIKGKIIFAKEFMNIIDFIGLKIKILFSSILAIPPKTKTFKNSEDKKISPSNETFNHYLLSIRQKKNQNGHTPKNQNSTLQKSSLLKKLRRDSTEELEEKGEYLLKDIYKSRPLISKVDQNFLKNLSLSKSREIHKSYLNNSYLPKTSRTNTHRTLYSNYVINQEKQSQTKIYQILERPSLGNIGNVTSRENSKNKSESLRKSKTQRSDFKIKSKNDTESQNQFNNNNKTVNQNNLKKIIDRLRGEKASQDQSYLKEYPVQSSRNMKNTLNIIEEKSSGFLTEKNSNFGPNHYNIEKENKVKTKPFQRNQTLKEMIFKLSSKDQNYINKIKSNIIETKDNNNLEIIYDDNYLLKQEAIKDITEISDNDLKLKKRTDLELFDINEEYQLLTKTDRSLKKIRFSLKTLHAESSYLKKTPRENIDSFLPRSSLRKSTNLGFFRKDSNEDDGKSILSLRSSLLPGNFISYFNQNPDYLDFEISKEERMKRIKAKKLILFQFRKYKKKKNAIAQNETLIITNPTENTANDKLPISNIGYYNQFLSQSAKFKKKSSPYKRTYTNLLVEDLIVPFQRKVTQIKVSEENSLKLIMKTYFSDCKKKNLGSKNIKDNENLFKEQHINKLENISRLSFFIMCFFEGKLKKIQIRIKKFLTDYLTINLNSNNFSFDLQLALDPETRDKALVENKTVWPIAFEALLNYMKSEKMVNENDLFEEIESFKKVTFASDYLKANNITIVDLENLGYLKMLIEVFLQKNFTMQRKCFGQTLIYQKAGYI